MGIAAVAAAAAVAAVAAGVDVYKRMPPEQKHRLLALAAGFEGVCVVPFLPDGSVIVYRDWSRNEALSWAGGKVEAEDFIAGLMIAARMRRWDRPVARATAARETLEETKVPIDPASLADAFETGAGSTTTGQPVVVFRLPLPARPRSVAGADLTVFSDFEFIGAEAAGLFRKFNRILLKPIAEHYGLRVERE